MTFSSLSSGVSQSLSSAELELWAKVCSALKKAGLDDLRLLGVQADLSPARLLSDLSGLFPSEIPLSIVGCFANLLSMATKASTFGARTRASSSTQRLDDAEAVAGSKRSRVAAESDAAVGVAGTGLRAVLRKRRALAKHVRKAGASTAGLADAARFTPGVHGAIVACCPVLIGPSCCSIWFGGLRAGQHLAGENPAMGKFQSLVAMDKG